MIRFVEVAADDVPASVPAFYVRETRGLSSLLVISRDVLYSIVSCRVFLRGKGKRVTGDFLSVFLSSFSFCLESLKSGSANIWAGQSQVLTCFGPTTGWRCVLVEPACCGFAGVGDIRMYRINISNAIYGVLVSSVNGRTAPCVAMKSQPFFSWQRSCVHLGTRAQ